jgi:hypothetical protein
MQYCANAFVRFSPLNPSYYRGWNPSSSLTNYDATCRSQQIDESFLLMLQIDAFVHYCFPQGIEAGAAYGNYRRAEAEGPSIAISDYQRQSGYTTNFPYFREQSPSGSIWIDG